MAYRESFRERWGDRLARPFRRGGERSWMWRLLLPLFLLLAIAYIIYAIFTFSIFWDRDIYWPQRILTEQESRAGQREALTGPGVGGEGSERIASPSEECVASRVVEAQVYLIDLVVNRNDWVASNPLFKMGPLFLADWEDTPWFDNKKSEQIGILDILRRLGIELTDSLGRVRGTSAENANLTNAQSALRVDANAWYVNNPFNDQINTISPSAEQSYRRSMELYQAYNRELDTCDAIFDTRRDNLREVLSRFTATLGATTTELIARTRATVYDPKTDLFVEADGNNRGWFDFHADNYFYRARGKMYALHGVMQAMRVDFNDVLAEANLDEVWDKMEQNLAEGAAVEPFVVSNGAADSAFQPDHLGKMAEIVLNARTSMVEIRDILRN
jgi:hypothetical protein